VVTIRVRVEIMGSGKSEIVGKYQPVLMMINPIIFTRTRSWQTSCHRCSVVITDHLSLEKVPPFEAKAHELDGCAGAAAALARPGRVDHTVAQARRLPNHLGGSARERAHAPLRLQASKPDASQYFMARTDVT
jgi:hypothetical protein